MAHWLRHRANMHIRNRSQRRLNLRTLLEGIAHPRTTARTTRGIVTSAGTGISGVAEAALTASVALTCNRQKVRTTQNENKLGINGKDARNISANTHAKLTKRKPNGIQCKTYPFETRNKRQPSSLSQILQQTIEIVQGKTKIGNGKGPKIQNVPWLEPLEI